MTTTTEVANEEEGLEDEVETTSNEAEESRLVSEAKVTDEADEADEGTGTITPPPEPPDEEADATMT